MRERAWTSGNVHVRIHFLRSNLRSVRVKQTLGGRPWRHQHHGPLLRDCVFARMLCNCTPTIHSTMPKPTTAQRILQSELDHAKRGLAYYQERVNMLDAAIRELNTPSARRQGRKQQDASTRRAPSNALPETGLAFWLKHITKRARTAPQITLSAAASLRIDPEKDRETFKMLRNRIGPALKTLVSSSQIEDSGSGRDRRYFKA